MTPRSGIMQGCVIEDHRTQETPTSMSASSLESPELLKNLMQLLRHGISYPKNLLLNYRFRPFPLTLMPPRAAMLDHTESPTLIGNFLPFNR